MLSFRPARRVCAGIFAVAAMLAVPGGARRRAAESRHHVRQLRGRLAPPRSRLPARAPRDRGPARAPSAPPGPRWSTARTSPTSPPGSRSRCPVAGTGSRASTGSRRRRSTTLPSGTYTVRAFFNVYETAHRSDGSTVDVHFPCGDGGRPFSSPGNLRSAMQTVTIDRNQDTSLALTLAEKLTPAQAVPAGGTCQQGNPAESAHVKQVKIKSERAQQVLGPGHVRRRHGAAAVGLRRRGQRGQALSGRLLAGPLLDGRPVRLQRDRDHRPVGLVARPREPEDDRRLVPHREPVLRRLLRRELAEPRAVRRRGQRRADPEARLDVPDDRAALCARPHRRLDRRVDHRRQPDLPAGPVRLGLVGLSGLARLQRPPDRRPLQRQQRLRRGQRRRHPVLALVQHRAPGSTPSP